MKAITVRQPWALHIMQSGKDVENRTRNIDLRTGAVVKWGERL